MAATGASIRAIGPARKTTRSPSTSTGRRRNARIARTSHTTPARLTSVTASATRQSHSASRKWTTASSSPASAANTHIIGARLR